MTSGILLIATSIISFFVARIYSNALKQNNSMGGSISRPKLFWLFFALSAYYIWPLIIWIEFSVSDPFARWIFIIFVFMLIRAVTQIIVMYGTRNWSPWMGISFNLLAFLISFYGLIKCFFMQGLDFTFHPWQILLIILSYCFLIDSYYAWAFWKLVGGATIGDKPIWFANAEDPKFSALNRVTSANNIILSLLFLSLIISCFYA